MAWIQFDSNSPKAPSMQLPTMDGDRLAVSDFRQRANLIIFFVSWECGECKNLVQQFAAQPSNLHYADAHVLVVVPGERLAKQLDVQLPYIHYVIDHESEMSMKYANLIDEQGKAKSMLFILDRFGVPWAAWSGEEPDEETYKESLDWLDFISIQCPE